jgi:hypothetical protein
MLVCVLLNRVYLLYRGATIERYDREALQWFLCCSAQWNLAGHAVCPKAHFAQWCNMALIHLLENN